MPEPPADAGPPAQPAPPDSDPATPMRDVVKPAERPPRKDSRGRRRWDRYDYIGAAIVAFLAALWVVHFSLPSLLPDNFPEANQPAGPLNSGVTRGER
jgi:hypothetical protein